MVDSNNKAASSSSGGGGEVRTNATKIIAMRMLQGYQLTKSKCPDCQVPLMSYNGEVTCVVCPNNSYDEDDEKIDQRLLEVAAAASIASAPMRAEKVLVAMATTMDNDYRDTIDGGKKLKKKDKDKDKKKKKRSSKNKEKKDKRESRHDEGDDDNDDDNSYDSSTRMTTSVMTEDGVELLPRLLPSYQQETRISGENEQEEETDMSDQHVGRSRSASDGSNGSSGYVVGSDEVPGTADINQVAEVSASEQSSAIKQEEDSNQSMHSAPAFRGTFIPKLLPQDGIDDEELSVQSEFYTSTTKRKAPARRIRNSRLLEAIDEMARTAKGQQQKPMVTPTVDPDGSLYYTPSMDEKSQLQATTTSSACSEITKVQSNTRAVNVLVDPLTASVADEQECYNKGKAFATQIIEETNTILDDLNSVAPNDHGGQDNAVSTKDTAQQQNRDPVQANTAEDEDELSCYNKGKAFATQIIQETNGILDDLHDVEETMSCMSGAMRSSLSPIVAEKKDSKSTSTSKPRCPSHSSDESFKSDRGKIDEGTDSASASQSNVENKSEVVGEISKDIVAASTQSSLPEDNSAYPNNRLSTPKLDEFEPASSSPTNHRALPTAAVEPSRAPPPPPSPRFAATPASSTHQGRKRMTINNLLSDQGLSRDHTSSTGGTTGGGSGGWLGASPGRKWASSSPKLYHPEDDNSAPQENEGIVGRHHEEPAVPPGKELRSVDQVIADNHDFFNELKHKRLLSKAELYQQKIDDAILGTIKPSSGKDAPGGRPYDPAEFADDEVSALSSALYSSREICTQTNSEADFHIAVNENDTNEEIQQRWRAANIREMKQRQLQEDMTSSSNSSRRLHMTVVGVRRMNSTVPDDEKKGLALRCIRKEKVVLPFDETNKHTFIATTPIPEESPSDLSSSKIKIELHSVNDESAFTSANEPMAKVETRSTGEALEEKDAQSKTSCTSSNSSHYALIDNMDEGVKSVAQPMAKVELRPTGEALEEKDAQSKKSCTSSYSSGYDLIDDMDEGVNETVSVEGLNDLSVAVQRGHNAAAGTLGKAHEAGVTEHQLPSDSSQMQRSIVSLSSYSVQQQSAHIAKLEAEALIKHQEAELAAANARMALEKMMMARNKRHAKKEIEMASGCDDVMKSGSKCDNDEEYKQDEDAANMSMCSTLSSVQRPTSISVPKDKQFEDPEGKINKKQSISSAAVASYALNEDTYSVASASQYSRHSSPGSICSSAKDNNEDGSTLNGKNIPEEAEESVEDEVSTNMDTIYDDQSEDETNTTASSYLDRHHRALESRQGRTPSRSGDDGIAYCQFTPRSSRFSRTRRVGAPPPHRYHEEESQGSSRFDDAESMSTTTSYSNSSTLGSLAEERETRPRYQEYSHSRRSQSTTPRSGGRRMRSNLLLPTLNSPSPDDDRIEPEGTRQVYQGEEPPAAYGRHRAVSSSPRHRNRTSTSGQPTMHSASLKPNHLLPYSSAQRGFKVAPTLSYNEPSRSADMRNRPIPLARRAESEPMSNQYHPHREPTMLSSTHRLEPRQSNSNQGRLPPPSPRGQYSASLVARMANLDTGANNQYPSSLAARMANLQVDTSHNRLLNSQYRPYGASSLTPKSLHEQERFGFKIQEQYGTNERDYPISRGVDSLSLAQHQTVQERLNQQRVNMESNVQLGGASYGARDNFGTNNVSSHTAAPGHYHNPMMMPPQQGPSNSSHKVHQTVQERLNQQRVNMESNVQLGGASYGARDNVGSNNVSSHTAAPGHYHNPMMMPPQQGPSNSSHKVRFANVYERDEQQQQLSSMMYHTQQPKQHLQQYETLPYYEGINAESRSDYPTMRHIGGGY